MFDFITNINNVNINANNTEKHISQNVNPSIGIDKPITLSRFLIGINAIITKLIGWAKI